MYDIHVRELEDICASNNNKKSRTNSIILSMKITIDSTLEIGYTQGC
jgi:hypothetical protein